MEYLVIANSGRAEAYAVTKTRVYTVKEKGLASSPKYHARPLYSGSKEEDAYIAILKDANYHAKRIECTDKDNEHLAEHGYWGDSYIEKVLESGIVEMDYEESNWSDDKEESALCAK